MAQRLPNREKALRSIAKLLGITMLLASAFGAGVLYENEHVLQVNHAAWALKKCNLSQAYAPRFCLRGFTGFRDTYEQIVFAVEEAQRPVLIQEISSQRDGQQSLFLPRTFWHFQKHSGIKNFHLFRRAWFLTHGFTEKLMNLQDMCMLRQAVSLRLALLGMDSNLPYMISKQG